MHIEALQIKYPIIDWEVHSEDTMKFWKITRVGNHTEVYQVLEDILKNFNREDMDKLWSLVKERFNSPGLTYDKEKELWVELKRLFKPDDNDTLWKLQRYMHDPLKWWLHDTCGVHHVSTERGHDIFMLTSYGIDQGLGSRSGIRAFALRNFDLEVMEFESAAKLPILKLGEYEILQKIVSRLAILGVVISQEDLNSKFLSSLSLEWNTHVVVWMNKAEIETMSIDDFYNNFKIVEQSVKKSVGASSGSLNLAFMTALSTSSTNDVNTTKPAYEVSTVSPNVNTASSQVSTASFSDNAVYAFMVDNPNGSNLL
ncbi:hypothetical protein Tco_1290795 [Tanacetum coccineum]